MYIPKEIYPRYRAHVHCTHEDIHIFVLQTITRILLDHSMFENHIEYQNVSVLH